MREIKKGKYRHFKGKEYELLDVATHSETEELYAVYRSLYGEGKLYIRPLDMFFSKVDKEKYPEIEQEYRFEYIGNN
jgi:Uncharacterized protein conserved in bacteria